MNKQTLIITDNKVMADTIAEALGFIPVEDQTLCYDNGQEIVLWTGGNLLEVDFTPGANVSEMPAEQILRGHAKITPRNQHGQVSALDVRRLALIERSVRSCDEVIFMCQPTEEGYLLAEAIKVFFDIEIPSRTVVLDEFSLENITDAVFLNPFPSKMEAFYTDKALQRRYICAIERKSSIKVDGEAVSPRAVKLLGGIAGRLKHELQWESLSSCPRKEELATVLTLDTLFIAMMVKYDLNVYSIWDSMLYLYAKGLISNPIAGGDPCPYKEEIVGNGYPGKTLPKTSFSNQIRLVKEADQSLIGLDYDWEHATDDFFPRTSAIYTFIVDATGGKEEFVEYPTVAEDQRLSLNRIWEYLYEIDKTLYTTSIHDSFGALIYELECSGMVQNDEGLLTIHDMGHRVIKAIGSRNK